MAIRLKAEIPLVSDDRSLLQSQSSLIQQNADKILLRVTQTDLSTQLQSYASITLLNNQIATRVSTTDLNNTLTNYSTITQLNNSIATRVATTNYNGNTIASLINQTATTIKIQADKIQLEGLVTITDFTYANLGGTKPPVDADRTSTVIDGGLITTGTIQVGSGSTVRAGINGGGTLGTEVRFWAGQTFINRATAPFRVTQDGQLFATNANISGSITANSGSIGRFAISGQDLVYTSELFDYPYDNTDVTRLRRILTGTISATSYDLWVYDTNSSGTLSIGDLVNIVSFIESGTALPTPRKRIRSVVTIGTNNGALITQAVAENGAVGEATTMRGNKITTSLINANSLNVASIAIAQISIGGTVYNLTRDSNGFLRAT